MQETDFLNCVIILAGSNIAVAFLFELLNFLLTREKKYAWFIFKWAWFAIHINSESNRTKQKPINVNINYHGEAEKALVLLWLSFALENRIVEAHTLTCSKRKNSWIHSINQPTNNGNLRVSITFSFIFLQLNDSSFSFLSL